MKKQFTYKTDEERIKRLKFKALSLGVPVNFLLDFLIDNNIDSIELYFNDYLKYKLEEK